MDWMFLNLDWGDIWHDARMPQVLQYLYGCRDQLQRLPEMFKQIFEGALAQDPDEEP